MPPEPKQNAKAIIWWVRQDLRLADNPALHACVESGLPVIPVFIWDDSELSVYGGTNVYGGAKKVWLHHSLITLAEQLDKLGSKLLLKQGDSVKILSDLAEDCGANTIHANRRYEPSERELEKECQQKNKSLTFKFHQEAHVLFEPEAVETGNGTPYQVFTPYHRKCLQQWPDELSPLPAPSKLAVPKQWPNSNKLDDLALLPTLDWAAGIIDDWTPSEEEAQHLLKTLFDKKITEYAVQRDIPSDKGTSRFSPYLAHGQITPRQIVHFLMTTKGAEKKKKEVEFFIREIIWRDFAHHILWHFPKTTAEPFKAKFNKLPWRKTNTASAQKLLQCWQKGQTGYPLVDAGMRQLWKTGWMHNRIRMVVGSFLVKDLLIDWQEGAAWFWDTLVDADLANNTMNWQWVGGCGADAQPFFRIFNPVSQSKKFDPEGEYIRQWVPELAKLPAKYLHQPWDAPAHVLHDADITIGENYPDPIVDHAHARQDALAAYGKLR